MTGFEIPLIIGGFGLQAYSSYQAGVDAKAQAEQDAAFSEYNAKVSSRQAEAQRQANIESSKQHSRRTEAALAKMRAQIGKSGVATTGSPLLVLEDTANQYELERASMLARGESQAQALKTQSILDISRADAYDEQGDVAYKSGLMGTGATILSGAGQVGMYQSSLNKPGGLTDQGKATILKY